jgi:hypothetical protein
VTSRTGRRVYDPKKDAFVFEKTRLRPRRT